jgi:hypothetical protein
MAILSFQTQYMLFVMRHHLDSLRLTSVIEEPSWSHHPSAAKVHETISNGIDSVPKDNILKVFRTLLRFKSVITECSILPH